MTPLSFPRRRESIQINTFATNGFVSVLLVLILLLAFGGLFYYAVTNPNLLKPQNTPEGTIEYVERKFGEERSNSSISQTESKSSWKTYTNSTNGVSIKYPSALILTESENKNSFTLQSRSQENMDDYQKYFDEYFSAGFGFYKKSDYKSLPEYVSVDSCDLLYRLSQQSGENMDVTKCKNDIANKFTPFEISNIKGITGEHTPYEQAYVYYIFEYGENVIVVNQAGAEGTAPSENSKNILLEVLTTLKNSR